MIMVIISKMMMLLILVLARSLMKVQSCDPFDLFALQLAVSILASSCCFVSLIYNFRLHTSWWYAYSFRLIALAVLRLCNAKCQCMLCILHTPKFDAYDVFQTFCYAQSFRLIILAVFRLYCEKWQCMLWLEPQPTSKNTFLDPVTETCLHAIKWLISS